MLFVSCRVSTSSLQGALALICLYECVDLADRVSKNEREVLSFEN